MLEAVVFDFDGVILDTPTFYFKHMKDYLRKLSSEITDEDISRLVALPFTENLEYIKKRYGLKIEASEFVNATTTAMKVEMAGSLVVDKDLRRLIDALFANSVKMAIASNNNPETLEHFLVELSIESEFSAIICAGRGLKPKPAPDTYSHAVKILGKNPAKCVAIEDTLVGVKAAKAAGLKCIAMPNKFTSAQNFSQADAIVKSFAGISFEMMQKMVG